MNPNIKPVLHLKGIILSLRQCAVLTYLYLHLCLYPLITTIISDPLATISWWMWWRYNIVLLSYFLCFHMQYAIVKLTVFQTMSRWDGVKIE